MMMYGHKQMSPFPSETQSTLVLLIPIVDSSMAEATSKMIKTKYAVVSGANKGIGFEICRQLASHGVKVVLTARDERRGLEALEKLKSSGFSDYVIFHQLDVMDSESIAVLAEFVESQFGKLDILVNNAGINGAIIHADKLKVAGPAIKGADTNWDDVMTQTYDTAVEGVQTNYYGTKRLCEALLPFLELSDSPRIVNVSSTSGKLKYIPNEWAKRVLNNAVNFGEESVDQVVNGFLEDFKEGELVAKNWPRFLAAYTVSKAAMNAYTRILAKKYPMFKINCVCPGFVKTDMTCHMGRLCVEEGAASPVRLALLPDDGPSGLFFVQKEVSSFED